MHAICQAIMSPMDKPKHALNPNPKNLRKMRTNSDQWGQQRSHQTIQKQQLVSNWGYWRGFPAKSTSVSLSLLHFPKQKWLKEHERLRNVQPWRRIAPSSPRATTRLPMSPSVCTPASSTAHLDTTPITLILAPMLLLLLLLVRSQAPLDPAIPWFN